MEIYCDLAGAKKMAGTTIPLDILPTQQRPDLVLINDSSKSIIIIELTVPSEQNIHNVHERKLDTKLLCVEVGSRGLITDSNACSFNLFSHDFVQQKIFEAGLKKISEISQSTSIICSYAIFIQNMTKGGQPWLVLFYSKQIGALSFSVLLFRVGSLTIYFVLRV